MYAPFPADPIFPTRIRANNLSIQIPRSIGKHTCSRLHNIEAVNGIIRLLKETPVPWSILQANIWSSAMERRKLISFIAHVYIYNALYRVTDEGRDIFLAQGIFMALYLVTLSFVFLCYRMANVCPYRALRSYSFIKAIGLTIIHRLHPTFFLSSSFQNAYIASSSFDSSTTVLRCSHCSWPFTSTSEGSLPLAAWRIHSELVLK